MTAWHNWIDALAYANARARVTGRKQHVRRHAISLTWYAAEVQP